MSNGLTAQVVATRVLHGPGLGPQAGPRPAGRPGPQPMGRAGPGFHDILRAGPGAGLKLAGRAGPGLVNNNFAGCGEGLGPQLSIAMSALFSTL